MSDTDEKLIIFGWITTILGMPEKADPTKYNELTDKIYELILSQNKEAVSKELNKLNKEHGVFCGAVFSKNSRDNCIMPDLVDTRIKQLKDNSNMGNK